MNGQSYSFIFKGGKAVQFILSEIPNMSQYMSDDIDILVMNEEGIPFNKENMENLSAHIGYLLKWFLSQTPLKLSLELPKYLLA
jgi:hypothetical protein